MIIVPYSFNPNRSLDRCVYSFPLIQVSLCHISITLCSMTLLGLGIASKLALLSPWVTFGILSPSLSRLSLLCLRQRCGQSARNKHHHHHLEGRIKFQPSVADAGARGHFVFQTIHILFLGIPTPSRMPPATLRQPAISLGAPTPPQKRWPLRADLPKQAIQPCKPLSARFGTKSSFSKAVVSR